MGIIRQSAPTVNPRLPFRPVTTCESVSWADFDNRLEFTIHRGNLAETYHVTPLSTDFAGVALRVQKVGRRANGETYDLLLGLPEDTSCTCAGFCFSDGCKHLRAVQLLAEAGVLQPAPGSAAGDADDDPAFLMD